MDAHWVDAPDLRFPALAAVEVPDQHQFDPLPYLDALADAVAAHPNGEVFEETRVRGIPDPRGHRLRCDRGTVDADHVVVATGIPFLDRGLFFAREEPTRSYALALRIDGELPEAMYLGIDQPTRSVRTLPDPTDPERRLLLVGGGSHVTGRHPDTISFHHDLLAWARAGFAVDEVTHRWSAQDYSTADGVPFVGPLWPWPGSSLVATGFAKWGFTNGSAAGLTLAGRLLGEPPPWSDTFDPARIGGTRGAGELLRLNATVGAHLVRDHVSVLTGGPGPSANASVPSGPPVEDAVLGDHGVEGSDPVDGSAPRGSVTRQGLRYVGRSDSPAGAEPCEVEVICPHLGGVLAWNNAEATWDCPLHGSRFDRCGHLLQGPATRDLTIRTPGSSEG